MTNIHITEKNFDSGFRWENGGCHIDTRLIPIIQDESPIVKKIISFQAHKCINTKIVSMDIYYRIIYLNEQIEKVYLNYNKIKRGEGIKNLYKYNFKKENLVHIMKRIIDDIIMILYVYYDIESFSKCLKINISSIGELNKSDSTKKVCLKKIQKTIKNHLNYEKFEPLFSTINDLHNAYKHCCFLPVSHMYFGTDSETLSAFYAKNNDINKTEYLNNNLMHIIISFSDFLLEFCDVETCNRQMKIDINEYNN